MPLSASMHKRVRSGFLPHVSGAAARAMQLRKCCKWVLLAPVTSTPYVTAGVPAVRTMCCVGMRARRKAWMRGTLRLKSCKRLTSDFTERLRPPPAGAPSNLPARLLVNLPVREERVTLQASLKEEAAELDTMRNIKKTKARATTNNVKSHDKQSQAPRQPKSRATT